MSAFQCRPNKILLSLLLPVFGHGMVVAAEAKPEPDGAQLDTVVVVGKRINAADKPFKTIGGVSHRGPDVLGEGATNMLRGIPGAFTQHDIGQPGVQVN
ncbi:MAG: hypothetical protein KA214_08190, partial [Neisseriaceae bacterium]|nr:hypothetical protein [Neisseriaceae bacterium]